MTFDGLTLSSENEFNVLSMLRLYSSSILSQEHNKIDGAQLRSHLHYNQSTYGNAPLPIFP